MLYVPVFVILDTNKVHFISIQNIFRAPFPFHVYVLHSSFYLQTQQYLYGGTPVFISRCNFLFCVIFLLAGLCVGLRQGCVKEQQFRRLVMCIEDKKRCKRSAWITTAKEWARNTLG